VVLSKALLVQAGLDGDATANVRVQGDSITLSKPVQQPWHGWSEAAAAMAAHGGDALLMVEFGNASDAELDW
jgi:antitoxin MazE